MTAATLGKWGNSLAVRIPGSVATVATLCYGDQVEIEASSGIITIRAATPRYTTQSMFAGRPAEQWRELYAGAYDWGPDLGRENLPE